jgi:hypothetical protein
MASGLSIDIRVRSDEASGKLKALREQVVSTVGGINNAGKAGIGIDTAGAAASSKQLAGALQEARFSAQGLREAMHLMHPVLRAAGLEIAGFRSLFLAAGAGAAALGAVITAVVTVALYNAGVEAEKTKRKIQDLAGGGDRGKQLYDAAKQVAGEQHTKVGTIGADLQILQDIENKRRAAEKAGLVGPDGGQMTFPEYRVNKDGKVEPWTPPPGSAVEKAMPMTRTDAGRAKFDQILRQLFRGGGASPEETDKGLAEIFGAFDQQMNRPGAVTPMLTGDIWDRIYKLSPKAAGRLSTGMGYSTPQDVERDLRSGAITQTLDQFSHLVQQLQPTAQKDYQNRAPPTSGEKWDEITNDFVNGVANFRDATEEIRSTFKPGAPVLQPPGLIGKPDALAPVSPKGVIPIAIPAHPVTAAPEAKPAAEGEEGALPPLAPSAPAAPQPQSAIVLRDPKTGEIKVIQPPLAGASQGSSKQTAAVLRDPNTGEVQVVQPPVAQPSPAPPQSKQTAAVLRDPKTGEIKVIQPDDVEGHALGGLIRVPGFAEGGLVEEIQELARKRGRHGERNVGIGPLLDLLKLKSPFLRGTGLAGGGAVSGPGSGTSDSILSLLSDGEYVIKSKAARRLGVDFLDSLNRFADGGPVSFGMPSSGDDALSFTPGRGASLAASSGASGPSHSVHLDFLVPPVEVKTDSDTLEAVTRAAVKKNMLQITQRQSAVG